MTGKWFFIGVIIFLWAGLFSDTVFSEGAGQDGAQTKESGQPKTEDAVLLDAFDSIGTSTRFQYNSDGRRDPFLSFVRPEGERLEGVPPLQSVAVSELKLIGVASTQGRVNAMIQVPGGKTYPVTIGTRIGVNRGRVRQIDRESVIVEEPYLNIFGRTALKQVVMKLYSNKGGEE